MGDRSARSCTISGDMPWARARTCMSARGVDNLRYIEDQRYAPIGYALSGIDSVFWALGNWDRRRYHHRCGQYPHRQRRGHPYRPLFRCIRKGRKHRNRCREIEIAGRGRSMQIPLGESATRETSRSQPMASGLPDQGILPDPALGFRLHGRVHLYQRRTRRGGNHGYRRRPRLTKEGGFRPTPGGRNRGDDRHCCRGCPDDRGAFITAASTGSGDAGNIDLRSGNSLAMRDSSLPRRPRWRRTAGISISTCRT